MNAREGRIAIAQLAADQWGLLSTAQASVHGVSKMLLSRMVADGELERVLHGVYATPSAAANEFTLRRAHWLSLNPNLMAEQRLRDAHTSGVMSHATAAALHGLGDIRDDVTEMTLPARHQSRRTDMRTYTAVLRPDEVTLVDGLPTTSVARTVADLALAGNDLDHVGAVLAQGVQRGQTSISAVGAILGRLAGPARAQNWITDLERAARLDRHGRITTLLETEDGRQVVQSIGESLAALIRIAMPVLPQQMVLSDELKKSLTSIAHPALPTSRNADSARGNDT